MYRSFLMFILTTAVFAFVGSSRASEPSQFDSLRDRLLSGAPTVSILHLDKCDHPDNKTASKGSSIGGLRINSFRVSPEPDPQIAYSHNHFSVRSDGTPILELIQYRVKSSDVATITVRMLSPKTYEQVAEPSVYNCRLGTGIEFKP